MLWPPMSNAAQWAASAGNKFREVQRSTRNPTTKLLAEGLTHLSEAVRELHQELGANRDQDQGSHRRVSVLVTDRAKRER